MYNHESLYISLPLSCMNYTIMWMNDYLVVPSFVLVSSVVWLHIVFCSELKFWLSPSPVMVPSVAWLQSASCSKSTFWVVSFTCHDSQCCLAPKCFLLKINILGGLLFMVSFAVWLQCVFHSKFHILGGSLHIYGSQCCLVPMCCSKSIFWVVPFTLHGSLCCFAPKCFPLKIISLVDSRPLFVVPSVV